MDKGTNQKIIIKLFCVVLSFALWFYVSNIENPNRTSDISNVPVQIENAEVLQGNNMVLSPDQNFTVTLSLEGPANEIYKLSKDDFSLKIDLSSYALKIGDNNIPAELVNYPQGITIKNTGNLTVKVKVEKLEQKEVNVVSKVKINFENGFSESSTSVNPQKVTVSGPASVIDKVESAALTGEVDSISSDFEQSFELKPIDKEGTEIIGATLSKSTALLSTKVAKEKEVPINLKYTGTLKAGLSIDSAELSSKTITISASPDIIDKIQSIDTEPLNLDNISDSGSYNLKLNLPDGVKTPNSDANVTAKVTIKNGEVVNKTIDSVQIQYNDANAALQYDEVPSVSITISGTQDNIANLTASNINITASLKDISTQGTYNVTWTAVLVNADSSVKIVNNTGTVSVTAK